MRNTLKQNQVQEYLGKTVSMVIKKIYLQSKETNKKPAKPFQALRHFFNQPSHIEIFPFLLSQIIPNARKGTSSLQNSPSRALSKTNWPPHLGILPFLSSQRIQNVSKAAPLCKTLPLGLFPNPRKEMTVISAKPPRTFLN